MSFLENLGNGIAKVIDSVVERNHRASVVNRLRIVIKNERENTARAYVALGKYYFDNLRDPENEETERLCRSVEESAARMQKAFAKMDEISSAGQTEDGDPCEGCEDDCASCRACGVPEAGAAEHEEPEPGVLSDFFTGRRRFIVLPDEEPDGEAADDEAWV